MSHRKIVPAGSTPPFGAYSHAVVADIGTSELAFVTGQIALDDQGQLISTDSAEQAQAVFQKVQDILESAGFELTDVVKAQVFLTDVSDFEVVAPIRDKFFEEAKPASTLVEVTALVREGCKVEVEVTAVRAKR